MSNDSDSTAGGAKGAGDPVLAFAAELRDLCLLGSFTVENILAERDLGKAAEPSMPFLEPMLRAASAFYDLGQAGAGAIGGKPTSDGPSSRADMASLVAEAYLVATASGLRYWRRLAQTYGAHQTGILRSLLARISDPNMSAEEHRTLTDEIRAYLRELGDVSLQEAHVFQSELEKLAAEVATGAGNDDEPSEHRRRWKAKP